MTGLFLSILFYLVGMIIIGVALDHIASKLYLFDKRIWREYGRPGFTFFLQKGMYSERLLSGRVFLRLKWRFLEDVFLGHLPADPRLLDQTKISILGVRTGLGLIIASIVIAIMWLVSFA